MQQPLRCTAAYQQISFQISLLSPTCWTGHCAAPSPKFSHQISRKRCCPPLQRAFGAFGPRRRLNWTRIQDLHPGTRRVQARLPNLVFPHCSARLTAQVPAGAVSSQRTIFDPGTMPHVSTTPLVSRMSGFDTILRIFQAGLYTACARSLFSICSRESIVSTIHSPDLVKVPGSY
ncbi:hypothetical protein NEOLEDRAFT_1131863 [Neolentinus lepideus HHB14362 ss-1]|uniref:Uncharacterized protein n=1 Tax=Neolentinus lepideus HHB14362 ss-1 TaxID=1314782 RepID=A0A165TKV6_9AGAM|nr:hypothetical protein NEOLEDRAFT_1131863 [Neolentinus lepideus HHB14362 ss-1]